MKKVRTIFCELIFLVRNDRVGVFVSVCNCCAAALLYNAIGNFAPIGRQLHISFELRNVAVTLCAWTVIVARPSVTCGAPNADVGHRVENSKPVIIGSRILRAINYWPINDEGKWTNSFVLVMSFVSSIQLRNPSFFKLFHTGKKFHICRMTTVTCQNSNRFIFLCWISFLFVMLNYSNYIKILVK